MICCDTCPYSPRATWHRQQAAQLLDKGFAGETHVFDTDIQIAVGMAALIHMLLAIEDRLHYGSESVLDGTISCRICRAILLEENAEGHAIWHSAAGGEA